ncbi:MAG: hypothetical protein IPN81_07295 [Nitrosomonadales bacterium]|nr:hypothetical protein [Nitrosomonadales bacterium]
MSTTQSRHTVAIQSYRHRGDSIHRHRGDLERSLVGIPETPRLATLAQKEQIADWSIRAWVCLKIKGSADSLPQ